MPHSLPIKTLPIRPTIPRDISRRIDRLSRRAHFFHCFAHHPLCEKYKGEIISLGRRNKICRGCAFTSLGLIGGVLLGVCFQPSPLVGWVLFSVAVALSICSLLIRLPKTLSRLIPAMLGGITLFAGQTVALIGGLLALGFILVYRRKKPNRSACQGCPEQFANVCSGFLPIVRRERAFQRLAGRWFPSSANR
jgi:hypothetical protein